MIPVTVLLLAIALDCTYSVEITTDLWVEEKKFSEVQTKPYQSGDPNTAIRIQSFEIDKIVQHTMETRGLNVDAVTKRVRAHMNGMGLISSLTASDPAWVEEHAAVMRPIMMGQKPAARPEQRVGAKDNTAQVKGESHKEIVV